MNDIDWNSIPDGYDWVAVDSDGELYAYQNVPRIGAWAWLVDDGLVEFIKVTSSNNWKNSLRLRPFKLKPRAEFKPTFEDLQAMYRESLKDDENDKINQSIDLALEAGNAVSHLSEAYWQAVNELHVLRKKHETLRGSYQAALGELMRMLEHGCTTAEIHAYFSGWIMYD